VVVVRLPRLGVAVREALECGGMQGLARSELGDYEGEQC
jgi:hypothetical protein